MIYKFAKTILGKFGFGFYNANYYEIDLIENVHHKNDNKLVFNIVNNHDYKFILRNISNFDELRFKKYLKLDSVCYVAKNKGVIVGYGWVNTRYVMVDGYVVKKIKNNGVFLMGCYIFEKYRKQGYFSEMIKFILNKYSLEGYSYLCCFTDRTNLFSNNAFSKITNKKINVKVIIYPFGGGISFKKVGVGKL